MSRIDDLVKELCPDGVEYRALGDVCDYPKDRIAAVDLDGSTFVGVDNLVADKKGRVDATYAPNTAALTRYAEGDVLIGNIRPYLKKVWLADRLGGASGDVLVLRLRPDFHGRLEDRFLYYLLSSDGFFAYDMRTSKGAKMPRGDKVAILRYRVPIPPLAVQREIVRILDHCTQLEAELEAELEARRDQYAYYRSRLLSFELSSNYSTAAEVRRLKVNDVARVARGQALTARSAVPGSYPVVANAPEPIYTHNEFNREGETIVVARSGANAGLVSYWTGRFFLTDAFSFQAKPGLIEPRFLFHSLQVIQERLHRMKLGAGVPHVRVKELAASDIPVPPLGEQRRIADILDRFDALVNDLDSGLPAEIAARRKQYEYYRDRLLTFPEKDAAA